MSTRLFLLLLLELATCVLVGGTAKVLEWKRGSKGILTFQLNGIFGEKVGLEGSVTAIHRIIPDLSYLTPDVPNCLFIHTEVKDVQTETEDKPVLALMHVHVQNSQNQWIWSHLSNATSSKVTKYLCSDYTGQNSTFDLYLKRPKLVSVMVPFEVTLQHFDYVTI